MKIFILLTVSFFNLLFWFFGVSSIFEIAFYFPLLSILLSIIFLFPKIRHGKIEIRIIYFVIAGIVYFNVPLYFKAVFSPNVLLNDLITLGLNANYFIKANLLFGISLPLIVVGHLKAFKTRLFRKNKILIANHSSPISLKIFSFLSIILLVLSLSITGLTIGSTYIGTSSYYYVLLSRSIYILCAILLYNRYIKKEDLYSVKRLNIEEISAFLIILLFIIYVLIGGDRGPAFTVILILIFGYVLLNNMVIKIRTLFLGLILISTFLVIFTFIEVLRLSEYEILNKDTFTSVLSTYEEYETIKGTSIRTTCLAIEGIEKGEYPHTYGQFFLQIIVKGVPFIGNYILSIFYDDSSIISEGSAHLLTVQNSGRFYTSGLGTTFLADLYIDFGLIGLIFISYVYGFLVGKFDLQCKLHQLKSFDKYLLIVIFVGFSFYSGRASLWFFLGNFIHTWIIYLFIKVLVKPFLKSDKRMMNIR